MKHLSLFAAAAVLAVAAHAAPEAENLAANGQTAIRDLGRINGLSLACRQTAAAGEAKALMIRHAPKTRRYGELFEEATNAAFLEQSKDIEPCPQPAQLAARLAELSTRLQAVLPAAP